jgi:uncharacterized protein
VGRVYASTAAGSAFHRHHTWRQQYQEKHRLLSALGFQRKFRATGEEVAFFDTGGTVIALFARAELAKDATLPDQDGRAAFRGFTLAWNCSSTEEVDAVLKFAISKGASLLKPARRTYYGGYFVDPDGYPWEVVVAPGIEVGDDRRVHLPD